MSLISRSSSLGPFLSATAQVVPSLSRPLIPAVSLKSHKFVSQPPQDALGHFSLASRIVSGPIKAVSGIAVPSQVRYAHTDVQMPDFSAYRRESVKDSSAVANSSVDNRRAFTYLMVAGGSVASVYAGKTIATEFVTSMSASADVLALAKIEVKLGDIPEGKSCTLKWRNKPLFIRHRTAEEIEREEAADVASLRDPQHDSERVQKSEWLVLLGVCTHLGCVPIANAGDYGGYFCPCHGSHYDASGRIRKGPAPLNLEVPEYSFMDESTLVVG